MASLFDNLTVDQDCNTIGFVNSREPMRDDEDRATDHQPFDGRLYLPF